MLISTSPGRVRFPRRGQLPLNAPPVPSFATPPAISPGSGEVGTTFTASWGTVLNGVVTGIQWTLGGADIDGANDTDIEAAAAGALRVEVTITGPGGTVTVVSNPVTVAVEGTATTFDASVPNCRVTRVGAYNNATRAFDVEILSPTEADWKIEFRYADTLTLLLAGTYAGGGVFTWGAGTSGTISASLAARTAPLTVAFARVVIGDKHGRWCLVAVHGAQAPTISSSLSVSAPENNRFERTIVASCTNPKLILVGGPDISQYDVTGMVLGLAAQDYDPPANTRSCSVLAQVLDKDSGLLSDIVTFTTSITNVAGDSPVTLDPFNKNYYVVLSAGNLKMNQPADIGDNTAAISNASRATGKFSAELTLPDMSGGVAFKFGVADITIDLGNDQFETSQGPGANGNPGAHLIMHPDFGAVQSAGGGLDQRDIIKTTGSIIVHLDIDMDAETLAAKMNGVSIGTAVSIAGVTNAVIWVSMEHAYAGGLGPVNFGSTAFAHPTATYGPM